MAKFAWKIERWWSKDRCITPADTRQWWNFEKKYFVLRRWKRNYWGCLPRGGLVAVFLTNRIFRARVSTVHNVLFPQFEFLTTLPTLANNCQQTFFNQSHFRGKSFNSSEDVETSAWAFPDSVCGKDAKRQDKAELSFFLCLGKQELKEPWSRCFSKSTMSGLVFFVLKKVFLWKKQLDQIFVRWAMISVNAEHDIQYNCSTGLSTSITRK